jgi:hypothetical protein
MSEPTSPAEQFDTRNPAGDPAPHPTSAAPPAVTRDYYLNVMDSRHYAVEKVGWEPARALGPIDPADIAKDVESLDWSQALNASQWNVRFLVRVCPREKALILSGKPRTMTFAGRQSLNFKAAMLNADVSDPNQPLEGAPPPTAAVTQEKSSHA